MPGFRSNSVSNCVYASNADFSGASSAADANGLQLDNQIWLGTTALNAGGTHINVATLTAGTGISLVNTAGALTINSSGGTITSVATANATPQFVLAGTVETINFALSNLILGSSAPSITSATFNVGLGFRVMEALTSGTTNTGIGFEALLALNSGVGNTATGHLSLNKVTTSSSNSGFGLNTLGNLQTGNGRNTAIGSSALLNIQSGTDNIGLGVNAGNNLTLTDSHNILIQNLGTTGESNAIHIGTQGSGTGQQNTTYIAGITGVTVSNPVMVTLNSSTGQLGNIASVIDGVLITSHTGVPSLLANAGTPGFILTANSGAPPSWQAAPSSGIPTIGTSTDRAIATWNGTTGAALFNNSTATITSGGILLTANGTAGAPTYSFTSATTTGLYRTSGGSVGIANGGVGYFTIDSGGGARLEGTLVVANELTAGASVNFALTTGAGNLSDVDNGYIFGFTDTSAPRTMTLSAGSSTGRVLYVKDQSGGAATNNITISVSGGTKTIDGSTSYIINTNYGSVGLYYNGTNYFTI